MSKALDLAMSICSQSVREPGIVHDWAIPLVVGSPEIGEVAIFSYNAVLHRVEIECASQSQGDTLSVLSFDSSGTIMIDNQPLASQADLNEAVTAAANAATVAQAAADTAQAAVGQVNDGVADMAAMINEFQATFNQQQTTITQQVAQASQSASNAAASAATGSTQATQAAASAGTAQNAAVESQQRASANSSVTFPDGSKSSAVYADLARQYSLASRLAITRALIAANFPETFQAGSLFKRARVTGGGARVVTVPQGVWPLGAGEAWATYRLEEAGSVQFVKQAGNTTGEVIPTLQTHSVGRQRYGTTAASSSITRTVAVPAMAAGKLVIIASAGWVNAVPVTMTCAFALTGGGTTFTSVTRQTAKTPANAGQNPEFAIFEATFASFAGGDVDVTLTAGPDANFQTFAAFVITGYGAAAPIQSRAESATNGSSASCVLTACPASGVILALGAQRGVNNAFASFSANVNALASGNMLGVPTASDTDSVKNCAWGYGVGVVPAAGDVTVQANFANANGGAGVSAICYPPGVGAVQPLVNMVYVGGRDTLNQVGAEATLWFAPDGRSVFVNVPPA